jgi:hypothetical protein
MTHNVHTLLSCMVFILLPTEAAGLGAEASELAEKHSVGFPYPCHIRGLGVVAARGVGVPAEAARGVGVPVGAARVVGVPAWGVGVPVVAARGVGVPGH